MQLLLVVLVGGLGVGSRFLIDQQFANVNHSFPITTFSINVFGSFLIGFMAVIGQERLLLSPLLVTLLTTGFLGGFTTFSSYAIQSLQLMETQMSAAVFYFIASPALGLASAFAGVYLARLLVH